jgi:hypothetical protein
VDAIAVLPTTEVRPGAPVSTAFFDRGISTFAAACQWAKDLPYGANARHDDPLAIFTDGRGTCMTKHGAIATLAAELSLDVHKHLGFYRLTEAIITGVDEVLRPAGLSFVPAIHCFLVSGRYRVDLTEGNRTGKNCDLDTFDFVVPVPPVNDREAMRGHFIRQLERYGAIEPRLTALGPQVVGELLQQCHQRAACQCAPLPEMAGVRVSR